MTTYVIKNFIREHLHDVLNVLALSILSTLLIFWFILDFILGSILGRSFQGWLCLLLFLFLLYWFGVVWNALVWLALVVVLLWLIFLFVFVLLWVLLGAEFDFLLLSVLGRCINIISLLVQCFLVVILALRFSRAHVTLFFIDTRSFLMIFSNVGFATYLELLRLLDILLGLIFLVLGFQLVLERSHCFYSGTWYSKQQL